MIKKTNIKIPKNTSREKKFIKIFIAVVLSVLFVYVATQYSVRAIENAERKARIVAIYDSLKLGSEYKVTQESVFGEKRVYDWDAGRSYSSSKNYERDADVDVTVAELRKSIEAAGFKFFDEPYAGSMHTQFHFKSDSKEYIRLTVSSKARDEAFHGKTAPSESDYAIDPNSGPSNVIIKVNLDDNNE